MMPPEAGVRPSDAGWALEAGLEALKGQQSALRGQCGRLTTTEGPSEVSVRPSKTGMGAVNSWPGFLGPRDN